MSMLALRNLSVGYQIHHTKYRLPHHVCMQHNLQFDTAFPWLIEHVERYVNVLLARFNLI